MSEDLPTGFRTEPDLSVDTASRAPTGAEFTSADRQAGWLLVNRWTYRLLRRMSAVMTPKADLSGVRTSTESVGQQRIEIVRPDAGTGAGAVFLIHGGGYVLGAPDQVLAKAAKLARSCGVPVFCPSYRLGPEHPFPALLDDLQRSWHWLADNASRFGADPAKIVVGGFSAGGGLAAGLVQRLHDEGGQQPAAQLLVYPMLDDRTATRTELDKPGHRVWNNRSNRFGWTSYLGHDPGSATTAPYAVPARREDLAGLPPAWIGVGTSDLFLDEDRNYLDRLRNAGVDAAYVEIAGGIHGFDNLAQTPLSDAFDDATASFVGRFVSGGD